MAIAPKLYARFGAGPGGTGGTEMKTTLTLTENEAEMLGYALTVAMKKRLDDAASLKSGGDAQELAKHHAREIGELRFLLDQAPQS